MHHIYTIFTVKLAYAPEAEPPSICVQLRTRNSQALRTPIGKSEAIYQTFTFIGSLAWNYISSKIPTDVSYIRFKNIAKLLYREIIYHKLD